METQTALNHIGNMLAQLALRIKHADAAGMYDINVLTEDLLRPVLAEAYGCSHLVNLNLGAGNYPGIDLGDEDAGIAFQITSEKTSAKVADTLRQYGEHALYETYPCLMIYIITEKQHSYSGRQWPKIVRGRFEFSAKANIIDSTDLFARIRQLAPRQISDIELYLSRYLGEQTASHVGSRMANLLEKQLDKQRNAKKYIPGVFVETTTVKEQARLFSCPSVFLNRIIDDIGRLALPEVNRILAQLDMAPVMLSEIPGTSEHVGIPGLEQYTVLIRSALGATLSELEPLCYSYRTGNQLDADRIPSAKQYRYSEQKYRLGAAATTVVYGIERILTEVEILESRVMLLVARAGQGKTNFVCDFVENVLEKRDIPCLFLTGQDLRHLQGGEINDYISDLVLGSAEKEHNLSLRMMNEYALRRGQLCIIVIDGINEHERVSEFSSVLERYIEQALKHSHIRILLTCRSEYFEQRFRNLSNSSFSECLLVKDMGGQMRESEKEAMLDGYFRFYNLDMRGLAAHVSETLKSDPLLLRMFCDVYGDPLSSASIPVPQMTSICRAELFKEYYRRKLVGVRSLIDDGNGPGLGLLTSCRQVLRCLIEWMIAKHQYGDIPLTSVPESNWDVTRALLAEGVVLRKDLPNASDPLADSVEVINFTFDEFRDYLIAQYAAGKLTKGNASEIGTLIDSVVDTDSPTSEGVRTYLFFAAYEADRSELLALLRQRSWFESVFMHHVFSLREELITPEVAIAVEERFTNDCQCASWVIRMLVIRWRPERYPRLNIRHLFRMLSRLDESAYDRLVRPSVSYPGVYGFDGSCSWTACEFAEEFGEIIASCDPIEVAEYAALAEMLVFFFPITKPLLSGTSPYDMFTQYMALCPSVARSILRKHADSEHQVIRRLVGEALARADSIACGASAPANRRDDGMVPGVDGAQKGCGASIDGSGSLIIAESGEVFWETIFVLPRRLSLEEMRVAAGTVPGTYADDLIERIHSTMYVYSKDLRCEYERYYTQEYSDFGSFVVHRYHPSPKVRENLRLPEASQRYYSYGRDHVGMLSDDHMSEMLSHLFELSGVADENSN